MINENAFEVFKNEVMEEECLQECEINSRVQTVHNQNPESEKNNERKHKIACSKNILEVKW
jgi:hypothetical protein